MQQSDSCADLGGSIGEFYSQRKNKNPIKMFIADTCKNYKLDFEEEVLVRGIPGYKYSARHSALDNGKNLRSKTVSLSFKITFHYDLLQVH